MTNAWPTWTALASIGRVNERENYVRFCVALHGMGVDACEWCVRACGVRLRSRARPLSVGPAARAFMCPPARLRLCASPLPRSLRPYPSGHGLGRRRLRQVDGAARSVVDGARTRRARHTAGNAVVHRQALTVRLTAVHLNSHGKWHTDLRSKGAPAADVSTQRGGGGAARHCAVRGGQPCARSPPRRAFR